jgi:tetratricopeptide (TPR) repeat protein
MSFDLEDIFERAKGSVRVGDHEEAERLLKQYLAKMPDERSAHLLLGTTLAREEKLDEAADEFTTLLAKNPQDVEALNNLAVIYRRQDKYQDALMALLDAIEIDPTRAEFHYNIGNIHKQQGNLKAASLAYSKVVEINPEYVHAYNNLGTIYDQLQEYDKAYNMFRKGLTIDRNNPTLHFNYGVALEANGRLEDALNEYKAALRSKPGWFQAMNNEGIIYFKQNHHAKAIETFNRILNTDPLNAEARNNIGVVLADQGKIKEAVENYRQAIEADPKYIKAVINLERVLEESGDFADAIVELEKLIKLVPNSAELRCRLASLYLKMERYPEASQEANSALEWEPENISALRVKGTTLRITGNDEEAQKVFEKILTLDPGNYAFQLDLADIHFTRKEYKEAEKRIMAFLSRRPNDRKAKMLLGRLYADMQNRAHAIQIFSELSATDPNDAEALAVMAELHKDAGEVEKALQTADKLVNLQGKRATSDDLTDLNESLAFYENAVKAYSSQVTDMWTKNLKLLHDAVTEETEGDTTLLMGAVEKTPFMEEETEALFIEDSGLGMEEEENELNLDNDMLLDDLPQIEEEPLPGMSLDNLAEPDNESFFGPLPKQMPDEPLTQDALPPRPLPDYPQEPQYPQPAQQPPQYQPSAPPPPPAPPPPARQPALRQPPVPAARQPAPQPPPQQAPQPPLPDDEPEALPIDDEIPLEDTGEAALAEDELLPEEESLGEEDAEDIFAETQEEEPLPAFQDEPQSESQNEAPEFIPAAETAEAEETTAEEIPGLSKDSIIALMNHLKDLSQSLPDDKKTDFMQSDAWLSMEHVIDILKEDEEPPPTPPSAPASAPAALPSALPSAPAAQTDFISTGSLPQVSIPELNDLSQTTDNSGLFDELRPKVQSIMSRIKTVMDKRKSDG